MPRRYPDAPVIGVGGIVADDAGRVLLVQRAQDPGAGLWTVPGGGVELGETLAAACAREVLEETGLEVEVGLLVTAVDRIGRDATGRVQYHFVIVDYLCRPLAGTLTAATDARAASWVTLDEARALPTTEGLLPVLESALVLRSRGR